MINLMKGDCLELMKTLPDASVDMILCDLPYGTTQNKWDSIIPLDKLWTAYWSVLKNDGVVILTATQPFSSLLVCSEMARFKYEWIWRKSRVTGVLNAKKQPLRQHESVLVFSKRPGLYQPQGLIDCHKQTGTGNKKDAGSSTNYGKITKTETGTYLQTQTGYPRSVLEIGSESKTVHPTQKPVALMEYMIKTYTHEGMTVLDNCMGSGTTGVACVTTGRSFIGMEMNDAYFDIAEKRINDAVKAVNP